MADYKILTIPFARDAVPDMVNDIPESPSPSEPQLASYRQGFPVITTIPLVAGGLPPEGQDFNGILRDITQHIVHQNQGGMYKFEPAVVSAGGYAKGAVLASNDDLSLWVSLQNNNVQDFNSGTPTQWARIAFSGLDALLNTKADKAVSINAGTGLTGGGDLSADRTLSVSYGTTADTAAQGNDSRITGAAQKSANLSDLTNAATARTNLGLDALLNGKLDATGNAVSATKLQTARTINGVAFDGTANITVADSTKLPLAGGTLTGTLIGTRGRFRGIGNDYHLGGLEVEGDGTNNTVFPTIGFHQPGLYASSIQLRAAADFRFYALAGAAYANVTAARFNGSAAGLTGVPASQLSGIVPDANLSGTYTGVNITGNAATATKLQTARTINGVPFDGSANITLDVYSKAEVNDIAIGAAQKEVDAKFTGTNVSLTENGYQRLPSGLIIQWGTTWCNFSGIQQHYAVTFPIVFPNSAFIANVSFAGGHVVSTTINTGVTSLSTSGFVIPTYSNNAHTQPVSWIAIGY